MFFLSDLNWFMFCSFSDGHTYFDPLLLCVMSKAQQMTDTMCGNDLKQKSIL